MHPLLVGYSFIIQVMGVLGVSVVCLHDPLDIVKGFVIDDLHCLFLGVTKHLLSLWFDKKYQTRDFYVGDKVLSAQLVFIAAIILYLCINNPTVTIKMFVVLMTID